MVEIIGLISIIGFFVGIGWAMYTQMSGTVTTSEFERLQVGQTLAEAEDVLGCRGSEPKASDELADGVQYTWENSSDSMVIAVFVDGKLVSKSATNLP